MAHDFRCPERRQTFLLPPDMRDWLPEDDIVHLILDAVALMDLSAFEATHKLGGAGQAPFAPSMLLSVLICAYSHGVRSSRAIERLCGRDAGYRFIVGEHVPDHTVIARFRRRHVERLEAVFVRVLEMCRDAGLIRLGLVVLDGTKVKANAALEANRPRCTNLASGTHRRTEWERAAAALLWDQGVAAVGGVADGRRRVTGNT